MIYGGATDNFMKEEASVELGLQLTLAQISFKVAIF
jgi:hypothetical protein